MIDQQDKISCAKTGTTIAFAGYLGDKEFGMELACDQALHFTWLTKSLALAFPFACYSRVTSRDAPNGELARRLGWNKRLANQSSTSSTTVNLSGLRNRSLSTYLRKGTGLSLPSNPWGRHSRSYHMYSYTSGLTCNCVCHHYTH